MPEAPPSCLWPNPAEHLISFVSIKLVSQPESHLLSVENCSSIVCQLDRPASIDRTTGEYLRTNTNFRVSFETHKNWKISTFCQINELGQVYVKWYYSWEMLRYVPAPLSKHVLKHAEPQRKRRCSAEVTGMEIIVRAPKKRGQRNNPNCGEVLNGVWSSDWW